MTDNEIIKALECCSKQYACNEECPLCDIDNIAYCIPTLLGNTLDLINRQKAEIERLQQPVFIMERREMTDEEIKRFQKQPAILTITPSDKTRRNEAIKEFAERFEDEMGEDFFNHYPFVLTALDNIVADMTEGGVDNAR